MTQENGASNIADENRKLAQLLAAHNEGSRSTLALALDTSALENDPNGGEL